MAKKPLVHCRICKGLIDRDTQKDWIMPQDRWYYHISCYEDFAKKRGAITEGDINVEVDDDLWFGAVFDYLTKDVKIALNFPKFQKQWNTYLKKNMTAKGIYFSLRYFYEVANGNPEKSENGIGIVPHIYNEGTCYWGERNQRDKGICDRIEAQILTNIQSTARVIRQSRRPRKNRPNIDLSSIANWEDEA